MPSKVKFFLLNKDFSNFKGLRYFDVTEKFVVKAVLEKAEGSRVFMIPANVGAPRKYLKYGVLKFELDGKSYSLTVFQSETAKKDEYRNLLFIPFRDLTNGKETYGAGRYLDPKMRPDGTTLVVDFNYAYNPYCAYSEGWSCPLPPWENVAKTPIPAGEKAFPRKHVHDRDNEG